MDRRDCNTQSVLRDEPDDSRATARGAVTAAACGKAIIVGEHAVVYGARAVAMPLPTMQVNMTLTPTHGWLDQGGMRVPAIEVWLSGKRMSDQLVGVVKDACRLLDIEPYPMRLESSSSVLIGAGLGSSASLCIVVLRALAKAHGKTLSTAELAHFGNELEHRFHGSPSGLDTAVVASEQVVAFTRGGKPEPLAVSGGPWRFALLDCGARASTLAMIQVAAPYFKGEGGTARLERFDALAAMVAGGLAAGDRAPVAEAMNEAAEHLDAAGIVSDGMRELVSLARQHGALAAKPTGAGGGGCVLALLDARAPAAPMQALAERLKGRFHEVSL